MSDSKVELTRITSNSNSFTDSSSPGTWQTPSVGDLNPTYHDVGGDQQPRPQIDPTSNDRMYDFVPGGVAGNNVPNPAESNSIVSDKPAVPPDRKVTTNTLYEPSSSTLHPQTLPKGYTINGDMDTEPDYDDESSNSCVRTACLSVLVIISLFLAVVAVVLVLLLWFGVIDTTTPECPTVTVTTTPSTPQAVTDDKCSCQDLSDLQPRIDEISAEAANLSAQIEMLSSQVESYAAQTSNVSSTTDSLDMSIDSVNSSCIASLSNVTNQLGSFQGLNFSAQLSNFGVFNSCVYEYIDECVMPQDTFECQTNYSAAIVPGYFNLDLACHVGVSNSMGAVLYAPVTNLRFNSSITVSSNTPAQEILDNSMVRCECSLISISTLSDQRNEIFHCKMYRARCLSIETFHTTVTA